MIASTFSRAAWEPRLASLASTHHDRRGKSIAGEYREIFIVAPDIDADLFRSLASMYSTFAREPHSTRRHPMVLWECQAGSARTQERALRRPSPFPPETTRSMYRLNLLDLGHSYYAEAAPISSTYSI